MNDFYTHRLGKLLEISGVADAFEARRKADPVFRRNWLTVRDWNEASRYDDSITESDARYMLKAVTDATAGILTWVRTQW